MGTNFSQIHKHSTLIEPHHATRRSSSYAKVLCQMVRNRKTFPLLVPTTASMLDSIENPRLSQSFTILSRKLRDMRTFSSKRKKTKILKTNFIKKRSNIAFQTCRHFSLMVGTLCMGNYYVPNISYIITYLV